VIDREDTERERSERVEREDEGEGRQPSPAPAPAEPEAPASGFEDERERSGRAERKAGDDPEAAAVADDIDELLGKARERDEYLSVAQRTQADFENYRKRAAKEIAAAEARGMAKLARELLPALDNLALALEADASGDDFVAGIRLVHSELHAALERLGIESYSPQGERFDPNVHEAMARQPVEGAEPGTIVEVYQQGYRMNGVVLRPARVVVAE
jgi:molecular chaperone GrpE